MNYQALWELTGWTMIHFLWVGALTAFVLAVFRFAVRRTAPNVRYSFSLAGFLVMAIAPLVIAGWLARDVDWSPKESVAQATAPPMEQFAANRQPDAEPPVIDLAETPLLVEPASSPAFVATEPPATAGPVLPAAEPEASRHPLLDALQQVPTCLPWLWIVGTPLMFLLIATGLVGSERLRRGATLLSDGPVHEATARLRAALGLSRQVSVAVSDRVLQPVLVGIVRPMILLPSAAVTGWSPEQLEMALLHELAHVRRWDNLVNVAQRVVEAVLFFHPCVWLVSRWLRADREQCCDAIVVAHTGAPEAYADLLIHVARDAQHRRLPSAAVALSSHPLARRVRRILQLEDEVMLVSKRSLVVVGLVFALLIAAGLWQGQPASMAEDNGSEPEASAPGDTGTTEDLTKESTEEEALLKTDNSQEAFAQNELREMLDDWEQEWIVDQPSFATAEDAVTDGPIDTDFSGTSKTYNLPAGALMQEMTPTILAHRRAGHDVVINETNDGAVQVIVTKKGSPGADASGSGDSPFLPLEQQRIADLAYKMLQVEIASIDGEQLKAVKEKGFAGGVVVDEFPGKENRAYISRPEAAGIEPGDILVGLHVWPTAGFDGLGEVLRRDDLNQFDPLKYYVLREVEDEEAVLKLQRERERERERQERETGAEFGGRGGEFGGRGGGRGGGEFGGFGRGGRGGFGRAGGDEPEVPTKWKLVTGRLSFDQPAWETEQRRLERVEQQRPDDGPNFRNIGTDPETGADIGVPMEENEEPDEGRWVGGSSKPQLLYDGRTFDDWRKQWKNELKTENRTEAIKALRAFGRAGQGRAATETILEVAEEYSMSSIGSDNSPTGALETAIAYSFIDVNDSNPIPGDQSLPVILPWYEEKPKDRQDLTFWVLSLAKASDQTVLEQVAELAADGPPHIRQAALTCLVNSDPELKSDLTLDTLKTHLADADDWVAINALKMLTTPVSTYPGHWYWGSELRTVMPEMLPLLFHKNIKVRQAARETLHRVNEEQLGDLATNLIKTVQDPAAAAAVYGKVFLDSGGDKETLRFRRLAAIRALAVLGDRAPEAVPSLEPLLLEDDMEIKIAAFVAWASNSGIKLDGNAWGQLDHKTLQTFGLVDETGEFNNSLLGELNRARTIEQNRLFFQQRARFGGGGGGGFGGGGVF